MILPQGVDALIDRLQKDAAGILGENFVGLYVYGSLATGGFDPDTSDVDFIVATHSPLTPEQLSALETLHHRLLIDGGSWAKKLEGGYVPLADLRRHNPNAGPFLFINEGQIYQAGLGADWAIQRHFLRTRPSTIVGPSLAAHIDPVSPEQIRDAVRLLFREWWMPMLDRPDQLGREDYRAFAVLTMCRALRLVGTGDMVSKPEAARWALEAVDARWHPAIRQAMAWKPGLPAPTVDDVRAMIMATGREVG